MSTTLGFTRPELLTIFAKRGMEPPTGRQLYYWAQTDLIEVTMLNKKTPVYSFQAVLDLMVIVRLMEGGVSLQRIRKALAYLQEHCGWRSAAGSLQAFDLMTDGEDIFRVDVEKLDEVVSLLKRPGQRGWRAFHFPAGEIVSGAAAVVLMQGWRNRLTAAEQVKYIPTAS